MTSPNTRQKKSASKQEGSVLKAIVDEEDEKLSFASVTEDKIGGSASHEAADAKDTKKREKAVHELQKVSYLHGSSDSVLEDEPFYHGYMTRMEADRLTTKDGEFLVRKTEVKGKEGAKLHLKIHEMRRLYWMKTYCFESVQSLIRYHMSMKVAVYEDVLLKSYVVREQWQLYHEQIVINERIGNGAFGEVFKGTLTVGLFTKPIEVAVKTLKSGSFTADDRITFLREANVMLKLQHKFIVRLYGVATQKEPIMIVMELAPGGSLLNKVRTQSIDLETKRKYCYQTVSGMQYLEAEKVMHRDLAARNCLISSNDSCKISDFGLSLMGHTHKERQMPKVPIRWLAPEVLQRGVFSNKSDVWSYGVLMFEVFSDGEVPYKAVSKLSEVRKKVIKEELHLDCPQNMPPEDAAIMTSCFVRDPAKRPSFEDLKNLYRKANRNTNKFSKVLGWFQKGEVAPHKRQLKVD
ncbi:hypothetical protein Q1695_001760 [Nippostrongylus brasiliensis]|nr:hypothetical protein Q1695_001760 [Nippostrongylus brasiliensis]